VSALIFVKARRVPNTILARFVATPTDLIMKPVVTLHCPGVHGMQWHTFTRSHPDWYAISSELRASFPSDRAVGGSSGEAAIVSRFNPEDGSIDYFFSPRAAGSHRS
jgi:hypothetical protein